MNKTILILPILMLSLTGCITVNTGGSKAATTNLGGLFKSVDKGETWKNVSALATTGTTGANFTKLNVASMAIDPSDNKAIYYGSSANGLLYSYDGAASWQLAKGLGQGTVESVSVDFKNKCSIYTSIKNKIYKSADCNRTWKQVYQDNDQISIVNKVATDPYSSDVVYAAIARGDLIKSEDGGNAWQVVKRFDNKIVKLIVSRKDSREIFVVTLTKGVFRSTDAGKNWTRLVEIDKALKDNAMKYEPRDFVVIDGEKERSFYFATFYGLLRSVDNGLTWTKLDLIAPKEKAAINAVAVNVANVNEIYYTTNTLFYKSTDAGKSWKTLPLPTARAGWQILIDDKEPSVIYLGVVELQK